MVTRSAFLTITGRQNILKELEYLREVRRKEVAQRIRIAAEEPDALDSPEYADAKDEQGFIEGRILKLETALSQAVVMPDEPTDHETVRIGCRVTVVDDDGEEDDLVIVGSAEVNAGLRRFSNESPVGSALMGRRAGETISVSAPGGVRNLTIVAIE